jgi:hypothetical protein
MTPRQLHPEWTAYPTRTGILVLRSSVVLEWCDDAAATFMALCDPAIHSVGDGLGRWLNWHPYWGHA